MADASPGVRRVAVLGSTGSIGRNTLEVIASHPDRLQLVGIAGRSRVEVLAQQWQACRPPLVAVWEDARAQEFSRLTGLQEVLVGLEGLITLATHPNVDVVVVASSGCHALVPLVRAIQAGKRIALASKELLVMAGELIARLVQEHGCALIPIDSEHAGLFQCLQGVERSQIERLWITGSGGPLWGKAGGALQAATRAEVLAHPKWRMGPKITVDSATLMNKGLEVIEAHWLFGMPLDRLHVVIHPEAAVHALVQLVDGSLLAQLSPCDMRLPIQYALSFPERWGNSLPRLDVSRLSALHFAQPDPALFPCLRLALQAAATGGTACAALNGANEVAVQAFLEDHISLAEIPRIIAQTLEQHQAAAHPTLDEVLAVDAWARQAASEQIPQCSPR